MGQTRRPNLIPFGENAAGLARALRAGMERAVSKTLTFHDVKQAVYRAIDLALDKDDAEIEKRYIAGGSTGTAYKWRTPKQMADAGNPYAHEGALGTLVLEELLLYRAMNYGDNDYNRRYAQTVNDELEKIGIVAKLSNAWALNFYPKEQ